MEDPSPKSLSENLDVKPSFRKLTSDAAGRNYRRHSPLGRSDSSSSGGSPKYERSRSPLLSKDNLTRVSSAQWRNDAGRESERDSHSSRNRLKRGHESQKHSEKYSYSNSHEYKRRDAYSKHDRQIDENDRNYQRSSRYARNDRSSDYSRVEKLSDRYTEIADDRNKDKEREYDKGFEKNDARRKFNQHYDSEQDRYRKRESHDYRSPYRRSSPVCKNDTACSKEQHAKEDHKRKYHEREDEKRERRTLFSQQEKHVDEASKNLDKKNQNSPAREVKDGPATHDEVPLSSSEPVGETNSTNKNAEAANVVGSAKFAAMKAAELVNKNLVGFGGVGCLSTDQKKKLLWGNKKNSSEESSSSWDLHLFSDQERQEKFNRLMSLRLPFWLWPIVGCEGQCGSRCQGRKGRKPPSKKTRGARHRLGEAIYSRPPSKRWSNSWSWIVMKLLYPRFERTQTCVLKNLTGLLVCERTLPCWFRREKLYVLPLVCFYAEHASSIFFIKMWD